MMSNLSPPALSQIAPGSETPLPAIEAARARDAAQQFEALLIAQFLRSVRESGGWGESEATGDCATDFAEQQFARVLAQQGGLGGITYWTVGGEPDRPGPNTFFQMVRSHFPRQ